MNIEIKEEADRLLYEIARLENIDIDSDSLSVDEIFEMIKKFLNNIKNETLI